MKILTQNLIAIVSLFLALALISSVLMYSTENNDLRWGLEEEVSSLAVATASFASSGKFEGFITENAKAPNKKPSDKNRRVQQSLLRLMGYGQIQRIYALAADGKKVVFNLKAPPLDAQSQDPNFPTKPKIQTNILKVPDSFTPAVFQNLANEFHRKPYVVSPLHQTSPTEGIITAYAPILGSSHQLLGIVGVDVNASDYLAKVKGIQFRALWMCVLGTLVGVGTAVLISSLITREVHGLNHAALEIAKGNLDLQIQAGNIREVGDLGSTFNTMSDVLKDVLSKTRRSLTEGEQFRTQKDLSSTYVEVFWEPIQVQQDGIEVVAQHIGGPTASFFGVFRAAGGSFATVGNLKEHESLQDMAAVSSAYSLWQQGLERHDPQVAFEKLKTLFEFEMLECIFWQNNGTSFQCWKLNLASGELLPSPCEIAPGKPFFLNTLGKAEAETMQRYGSLFGHLPPAELFKDILVALPSDAMGSLLIASKVASA